MKYKAEEKSYKDPVCGMEVSRLTVVEALEYEGKTYYFCAEVCKEAFEKEPDKYIKGHRQHGMT